MRDDNFRDSEIHFIVSMTCSYVVDLNAILKHYQDEEKLHLEKQEHEDEELVQSIFHGSSIVKRLDDNNSSEDEERVPSKDQSASLKRPSTDFLGKYVICACLAQN